MLTRTPHKKTFLARKGHAFTLFTDKIHYTKVSVSYHEPTAVNKGKNGFFLD
jgi:hypothetical protein